MSLVPPFPTSPLGAHPGAGLAVRHRFHGLQPVLPVMDVQRAARWFRDVLGFEIDFVAGEPPSYARVKHLPSAEAASEGWRGARDGGEVLYIRLWQCLRGHAPSWRGELVIHVGHDLDGLYATYVARGVTVLEPPVSQPWGLREFVIREPDGHALRFCGAV